MGNHNQLPPSGDPQNLPAVQAVYTVPPPSGWYGPEPEPEEPAVPLSHYLWILRRHKWKIASFVVAAVAATAIISGRLTPIYESTATVDIDRRAPAGIIGQEANQYPTNDADQFLATQIRLIQSDSVLRPVVERYNLRAERPDVPAAATADAPVRLEGLKVTRPPRTYLLLISYRSPNPRLAAEVANAIANSYIEHTFSIRYRSTANLSKFMEKQLEDLRAKMERSSEALAAFERDLSVINPEEKTNILSARLLQLNSEYTAAQSDRVRKQAAYNSVSSGSLDAAAVSTQGEALGRLQQRLDEAQQKFAEVKSQFGSRHPEYRKAATQVATLEKQIADTRTAIARRVEAEYRTALQRERILEKAVAATKAEYDALNARSFQYQALKQEAEADRKLYEELTTRIKQAGINAGFDNNAVRLADPARPPLSPVFPNLKLNLLLAFVLSSLLAVGAAVLSDVLDNTVRDGAEIRRLFNTEVVGVLPLIREWRRRRKALPAAVSRSMLGLEAGESQAASETSSGASADAGKALAAKSPAGTAAAASPAPAVLTAPPEPPAAFREAIRTLRNSILLGVFDRPLRSILVTSAQPGDGKSTTALHLAIAHAEQGHKTLLIDADLRRPTLHQAFGLGVETSGGLTAALSNGLEWRGRVARVEDLPELDVLTAGRVNRRSPDLLGPGIIRLLDEAAAEYDLVVLDAPPLLGFPEPLQLAVAVDGVLVVSKSGQTDRKALGAVFAALQRVRAGVIGLVLNEVGKHHGDGYSDYSYYTYGKYYKHYGRE